eukprot:1143259-Pelagomonas_calceolata.AAC.1
MPKPGCPSRGTWPQLGCAVEPSFSETHFWMHRTQHITYKTARMPFQGYLASAGLRLKLLRRTLRAFHPEPCFWFHTELSGSS